MEAFQSVLPFATALSFLVIALVSLVKKSVDVPKKYISLIGFGLGLLLGFLAWPFTDLDVVRRVWSGGIAGLMATGLFEIVKNRPGTTKEK